MARPDRDNASRLPRGALRVLRLLLPDHQAESLALEIDQEALREFPDPDRRNVRRWLWIWRQVLSPSTLRLRWALQRRGLGRPSPLDGVGADFRVAVRQLRLHPLFSATVIATLALGIGANTAIFSVVYGVLLRPLPYPDSEFLFALYSLPRTGPERDFVPDRDFASLLEHAEDVRLAAIDETLLMPLTIGDVTEAVSLSRVYHTFFDVLGIQPWLGRTFAPEDGLPDGSAGWRPDALVISHDLWQERFGGDPSVLGLEVRLSGRPGWIVGVMPDDFVPLLPPDFGVSPDIQVWRPTRYDYSAQDRDQSQRVVGRAAGGGLLGARRELESLLAGLPESDPTFYDAPYRFRLVPLLAEVVVSVRGTLTLLLGAVGFVLLIACANVANLLMARGTTRRGELAVRAALGAGRGRIVRQILTESLVLSALGMTAGVGLAVAGVQILKTAGPEDVPRLAAISLDLPVLVFSIGLTVAATLACGLLPAWRASRGGGLVGGERTVTADPVTGRMQAALAIAQVALSIVLISGAGLMVRSVARMQRAPIGFDPSNLVAFRSNLINACDWVDGSLTNCGGPDRNALSREIAGALRELPGVEEVGWGFPLPMNGVYSRVAAYAREEHRTDPRRRRPMYFRTVNETFFAAIGIDLIAGRAFQPEDGPIDEGVRRILIDERIAEREWPGESAVGKQLALFDWWLERDRPYEVIGVVEYVPQWDHWDQRPTIYVAREQWPSIEVSWILRMVAPPGPGFAQRVREGLHAVDPDLPVEMVDMNGLVEATMRRERFVVALLAVFSMLATLLASVGLYGVLSYRVRRQFREIGIRMALGAPQRHVARRIVGSGMRLALVGLVSGVALALALGGVMRRLLYETAPRDPVALGGAVLTVALVALLACALPARRAAAADPATVLRED